MQTVRYSPNGEYYATGGFDGKIFVYEGKDGELKKELGCPAHKGGVYAVCISSFCNFENLLCMRQFGSRHLALT